MVGILQQHESVPWSIFMHEKNLRRVKKLRNKERVFEAEMDGEPVVVKFQDCMGKLPILY